MRLLNKIFGDSAGASGASTEPAEVAGHRRPEHPRAYLEPTQALLGPLPSRTPAQKPAAAARDKDKKAARQAPAVSKRDAAGSAREPLDPRPQPAAERAVEPASRPLSSRPPHALVVSPVSLTPEEVQLPPGTRQKMPTLFGLGAPMETAPDITEQVQLLVEFALELSLGPVPASWVPALRRGLEALLAAARQRHAPEVTQSLGRLHALSRDEPAPGAAPSPDVVQGALREQLLAELSLLAEVLHEWPPSARDLKAEARRREARILRELVARVDGLRRSVRARLESSSLQALGALSLAALAQEIEAPLERAAELREVLDGYSRERLSRGPGAARTLALEQALEALEQSCRAFDACEPDQEHEQRALRSARRIAVSELSVRLAERGELTWLDQLEPLASGQRAESVRRWLAELQGRGLPNPRSSPKGTSRAWSP